MTYFEENSDTLRAKIAESAARLIAEEGICDYGFAKRKAAKQLNLSSKKDLPSNEEVQAALKTWLTLFQDDEHPARIAHMRQASLNLMRFLEAFDPYLTGLVLEGLAGRFSWAEIEVFPESSKIIEIELLNAGIEYEHKTVQRAGAGAPEMILAFDWEDIPVRLNVYTSHANRMQRKPLGKQPIQRANIKALQALLLSQEQAKTV